MSILRIGLFVMSMGLMQTGAGAVAGDVLNGRELAEEWCARCHDISPGGPFKLSPPSFAAIAAYRAADDIRWRIQFPPVHAAMPRLGFVLDAKALDDLTAFIQSLEATGD